MTRRLAGTGLCAGLIAGAACHTPPRAAPVPLEGTRADLSGARRHLGGPVLERGDRATGQGNVPAPVRRGHGLRRGSNDLSRALRLYDAKEEVDPALRREPSTTIDIAVVRIEGRRVRGTLAPYWDPGCDCRTRTVFDGELVEDNIARAFTSRREAEAAVEVTGLWFADREPK